MNDRFRVLKKQATSYTWNGADVTEELDEDLFAELIVRECARIADMVSENKAEWVGGNILVYFGVKE